MQPCIPSHRPTHTHLNSTDAHIQHPISTCTSGHLCVGVVPGVSEIGSAPFLHGAWDSRNWHCFDQRCKTPTTYTHTDKHTHTRARHAHAGTRARGHAHTPCIRSCAARLLVGVDAFEGHTHTLTPIHYTHQTPQAVLHFWSALTRSRGSHDGMNRMVDQASPSLWLGPWHSGTRL